MATTTQLASFTAGTVYPLLATSATAAASFCNQGTNNTQCTMWWTNSSGPPTLGVGQQMSALNVFNANMMKFVEKSSVTTANTGGTSQGNPDAGSTTSDQITMYHHLSNYMLINRITPATTGDKAFAGILTAIFSVGGCGFAAWLTL
jgi:mannan endo-1,6-alpha-mannosidase